MTKRTIKQSNEATNEHKAANVAKRTKAAAGGNVITTSDLAAQHNMTSKTLRARIRRNIDKWEPLFKDGTRHVFPDNKTTRAKLEALLA